MVNISNVIADYENMVFETELFSTVAKEIKYPSFIMLVGLPGAGKSSWAKVYTRCHNNACVISSDSLREEVYGDVNCQDNPELIFKIMHERALENLNNGISVIYDATNLSRKYRARTLSNIPKMFHTECVVVWSTVQECIERDAKRERTVGKNVIYRMLKTFDAPFYDEGFNSIQIVNNSALTRLSYMQKIFDDNNIPHDNPHHTYGILEHMKACGDYVAQSNHANKHLIRTCAYLHDIGKAYCKDFHNGKGEETETAHYYQHHCIGAYLSYGIIGSVFCAWMIWAHMTPYNNKKYYDNLPKYLKDMIDILHEADVNAH